MYYIKIIRLKGQSFEGLCLSENNRIINFCEILMMTFIRTDTQRKQFELDSITM